MSHFTPPPPPPASSYSSTATHSSSQKTRRWPWILGLVAALAAGGAIGTSMTPEPEVVTQEIEVEPADIGQRREALEQQATELQEREDELAEYETELEQRSTDLDEQLEAFEAAQAEAETTADEAEAEQASDDHTTIPGSGTFVVGEDIEPGTYSTEGSDLCYWARLSGLSGEFTDIITNGVPQGPAYVTIAASDVAFETASCGTWTLQ